ncbi:MAG: hypothetical protein N3C12_10360 [Candidatus Binatia bacterium]|nr:hypothetical protein [Candidatus Binatia bacterium]
MHVVIPVYRRQLVCHRGHRLTVDVGGRIVLDPELRQPRKKIDLAIFARTAQGVCDCLVFLDSLWTNDNQLSRVVAQELRRAGDRRGSQIYWRLAQRGRWMRSVLTDLSRARLSRRGWGTPRSTLLQKFGLTIPWRTLWRTMTSKRRNLFGYAFSPSTIRTLKDLGIFDLAVRAQALPLRRYRDGTLAFAFAQAEGVWVLRVPRRRLRCLLVLRHGIDVGLGTALGGRWVPFQNLLRTHLRGVSTRKALVVQPHAVFLERFVRKSIGRMNRGLRRRVDGRQFWLICRRRTKVFGGPTFTFFLSHTQPHPYQALQRRVEPLRRKVNALWHMGFGLRRGTLVYARVRTDGSIDLREFFTFVPYGRQRVPRVQNPQTGVFDSWEELAAEIAKCGRELHKVLDVAVGSACLVRWAKTCRDRNHSRFMKRFALKELHAATAEEAQA